MATAKKQREILVGVFNDRIEAERTIDDLERAGFAHHDLGFALRGSDVSFGGMVTDAVGTKDAHGAVTGAVAGSIVGGLLGTAAALLLPGIGEVLLAGVLASALGFGGAGAAIGGLLGAMTGAGISEDEAKFYEREFHSGKALVTVRAGEREEAATAIIRLHGGYDMHARPEQIRR